MLNLDFRLLILRILPVSLFWLSVTSCCPADGQGVYSLTELGPLPADAFSFATGINNLGQVTGFFETSTALHPFLWQNGMMTDLLPSYDQPAYGTGINNLGQVVMSRFDSHGRLIGGIWLPIPSYGLPAGPNDISMDLPTAINDAGRVAGLARVADPANGTVAPAGV